MMTDDLCTCKKCGFSRALTHYSSCNLVNWVACPKCKTFFVNDVEQKDFCENTETFWKKVEEDTGFR
jgi:hypothetical protein